MQIDRYYDENDRMRGLVLKAHNEADSGFMENLYEFLEKEASASLSSQEHADSTTEDLRNKEPFIVDVEDDGTGCYKVKDDREEGSEEGLLGGAGDGELDAPQSG